jgi:predicted GNAT superfamily acetyltransferase
LQDEVWGRDFSVPVNITVAIAHHGGVAIGAFDTKTGEMLGFVLSFVAPTQYKSARNGLSHHSHMAAVTERWRGYGLGARLKLAQREAVLAQGINLITWTFDPLEARNANLNVNRLGCICRVYERDLYGSMGDNLNAGIPTDRFEAEWWLDENKPQSAPDSPILHIEIPISYQAVKQRSLQEAFELRQRSRVQFEQALQEGFAVTAFSLRGTSAWYTLTRLSANPV